MSKARRNENTLERMERWRGHLEPLEAMEDVVLAPIPDEERYRNKTKKERYLREYEGSRNHLYVDLHALPPMNREQEAHQFRKYNYLQWLYHMKDRREVYGHMKDTRDFLYLANVGMLCKTAKRVALSRAPKHLYLRRPKLDMDFYWWSFSEGCVIISRCIDRFDYSKGWGFSTYFYRSYFKDMWRILSKEDVYRANHKVTSQISTSKTGREGISSIDYALLTDEAERNREEWLGYVRYELEEGMKHLDDKEREFLNLLYGLDGMQEPINTVELANQKGVSKQWVSDVKKKAIRKLRRALGNKLTEEQEG